jgi:hypothetical protein
MGEDNLYSIEGFTSVFEVNERFQEVARVKWPDPHKLDPSGHQSEDEISLFHANAWNRWASSTESLLVFLSEGTQLFACSPRGVSFRVHYSVLSRELAATRVGFTGMWVVNHSSWQLDCSRAMKWLDDAEKRNRSLQISLKALKFESVERQKTLVRLISLRQAMTRSKSLLDGFGALDGCALAIRDEDAPSTDSIREMLGETQAEKVTNVGRPSQRDLIVDSYNRLFPSGHLKQPWKVVQRKIENDCGVSVHVDTIKRALGLR